MAGLGLAALLQPPTLALIGRCCRDTMWLAAAALASVLPLAADQGVLGRHDHGPTIHCVEPRLLIGSQRVTARQIRWQVRRRRPPAWTRPCRASLLQRFPAPIAPAPRLVRARRRL